MAGRILIVEDDEALSLLIQYNLEAEGYRVEIATRAEDADLVLRECPPDLLLLDWMLPGFSGLDSPAASVAAGPKGLPIIIVTARGEENDGAQIFHRRRRLYSQAFLGSGTSCTGALAAS